jgi:hypothetical protein
MKMVPIKKVQELREIASARTIHRWLENGVLAGVKLGGRWFVAPEAGFSTL